MRFASTEALQAHLETHGEQGGTCLWSGCCKQARNGKGTNPSDRLVFTAKVKMFEHLRRHTRCLPYVCAYEGKTTCEDSYATTRKDALRSHYLRKHRLSKTEAEKLLKNVA